MPEQASHLSLRTANREDAYMLWIWSNDEETRRASFGRDVIAWETHIRWLEQQLHSELAVIFVAHDEAGQPCGSIRFDTADGWKTARLSYVIAPEMRGRGLSAALVAKGTAALRERQAAAQVRAVVASENERSLRVFRRLGWTESRDDGSHEFWDLG